MSSAHALYANDVRLECVPQVDEAVEVDGEVATILTHSRFKQDFTFQPPGGPSEPCGGKPNKVSVTTKFLDVEMSLCDFSLSTRGQCVLSCRFQVCDTPREPRCLNCARSHTCVCAPGHMLHVLTHSHTHSNIHTHTSTRTRSSSCLGVITRRRSHAGEP